MVMPDREKDEKNVVCWKYVFVYFLSDVVHKLYARNEENRNSIMLNVLHFIVNFSTKMEISIERDKR